MSDAGLPAVTIIWNEYRGRDRHLETMQIPTFRPKQFLLLVYDIWAVNVALFLAYFFRHNTTLFEHMEGDYPTRAALDLACY